MIKINKRPEPKEWTARRTTPGVTQYSPIPELKVALLQEQGYLCAFCMRRIPVHDEGESETSKNAHLLSRSGHPDDENNFNNLVASCPGMIDGTPHCDKSQASMDVTLPLFNVQLQQSIGYGSHTGEIRSSNSAWDHEIQNILCLNNARLKSNRLQTLDGVRSVLEGSKWKRAKIEEKLAEWADPDQEGRLKAYCGVVIWYLGRKLRQG